MVLDPTKVTAAITIGEEVFTFVVKDVEGFISWMRANTDAADTTQLEDNAEKLKAAIAEETAKAAGTS